MQWAVRSWQFATFLYAKSVPGGGGAVKSNTAGSGSTSGAGMDAGAHAPDDWRVVLATYVPHVVGCVVGGLLTEDPTAISSPEVGLFRAFADAVGADRRALAAQAAAVHSRPIDTAAIKVPTLVLAGDADPLAVRPQVLADAIPGAKLAVVPGDHLTAVTNPAFASAVVSFLA